MCGKMKKPVILASGSEIRAQLLENAGVEFTAKTSRIDETTVLAALLEEKAKPRDIAGTLAELKARRIAMTFNKEIVIGADQILVCDGEVYSKPENQKTARQQLQRLRGKGHQLLSAAVIFEDGIPIWRHIGRAQLVVRNFSDGFLDEYLEKNGGDALSSVGCYKLERRGVQLFSSVQGDYFTVLGLPLVEVLGFLRSRGALTE